MQQRTRPPMISVIMPVRDEAAFLEDSILSIRAQSHRHFELLILVDERSKDKTRRIADKHALLDERVQVFTTPPVSRAEAINIGLNRSRGDVFTHATSENKYNPTAFADLLQEMKLTMAALVYSDYSSAKVKDENERHSKLGSFSFEALKKNNIVGICFLIHSDMIARCGLYSTNWRCVEDWEFFLRVTRQYRVSEVEKVLCHRRADGLESSLLHQRDLANWSKKLVWDHRHSRKDNNVVIDSIYCNRSDAAKYIIMNRLRSIHPSISFRTEIVS